MKTSNTEDHYIETNTIEALESDYLFVKTSQIKNAGKGLFTAIDIYKNEIISLFKGEVIDNTEAAKRVERGEDKYFINLLDDSILDSMHIDCFAKYANDAEGFSKGKFRNNAKITLDDDNNVCIKATKDIDFGDEVFCSYGKRYWKKHG